MGGGIFKYGNPTGFLSLYFKFDPSKIADFYIASVSDGQSEYHYRFIPFISAVEPHNFF